MKRDNHAKQTPSIEDLPIWKLAQAQKNKHRGGDPAKFVSQAPEYVVFLAKLGNEVASTRFPFELFKILGNSFLQSSVFQAAERQDAQQGAKMQYRIDIEYDPITKILTGWVYSGDRCVYELATRRIKPAGRPPANYEAPIVRPMPRKV